MKSKAAVLHQNVPPDWYERGIKRNLGQRYWHFRRFSEVGKLIAPTKGTILDIGCADGTFTRVIFDRARPEALVGIDILPGSVKYSQNKFKTYKNTKFLVADAERLPFKNESYDAVFCLEVLEHVFSPKKVLGEIKRVLKKDGYAVLLVPSESLLFKVVWAIWLRTGGGVWQNTHLHRYDRLKLGRIVEEAGLKINKEKSFLFGMLKAVKLERC